MKKRIHRKRWFSYWAGKHVRMWRTVSDRGIESRQWNYKGLGIFCFSFLIMISHVAGTWTHMLPVDVINLYICHSSQSPLIPGVKVGSGDTFMPCLLPPLGATSQICTGMMLGWWHDGGLINMHGHRWQRCYGLMKLQGEGSRQHEAAGVRVETLTHWLHMPGCFQTMKKGRTVPADANKVGIKKLNDQKK